MIKLSQQLKLFPEENTTEESKQVVIDQTSEQVTGEEFGKVASEGDPSDIGTNSQKAVDKGKEKALETTKKIEKITEDREDMQLDFTLKWKLGEGYEEKFIIFGYPYIFVEPDQE